MKNYIKCKGTKITKTLLLRLQKKFKTDRIIGEFLGGVTRQYVKQCRDYFGIGTSRKYDEVAAFVKKEYKKGKHVKQIAKKLNLSVSQIYRYINR